ncbi:MAG: inorganic pyrophosphatase [Myxococcota bacterium]|jgi:inorganic pyrophosphatase
MNFPEPFYRWRPHPWHGLSVGPKVPQVVHAYIEMTPSDPVKYEIDKATGYLRVDRPQRTNSLPPALYGFIPRTWCGPRVAALNAEAEQGDCDPLDIMVLSERPINRAEVLLDARVVGVVRMIDGGEADDKIIAVLHNDDVYAQARSLSDLPPVLIERIQHYFLTYKMAPGTDNAVRIAGVEDADVAFDIIRAAMTDYEEGFGG